MVCAKLLTKFTPVSPVPLPTPHPTTKIIAPRVHSSWMGSNGEFGSTEHHQKRRMPLPRPVSKSSSTCFLFSAFQLESQDRLESSKAMPAKMVATGCLWLLNFRWVQTKSNEKFSFSVILATCQMLTSQMGSRHLRRPQWRVLLQDPRILNGHVEGYPPTRDTHVELCVQVSNFY